MEYCLCPDVMPVETVDPGTQGAQVAVKRELLVISADQVAPKSLHAGVLSLCSATGDHLSANELCGKKKDFLYSMTEKLCQVLMQRDQLHEVKLRL